MSALLAPARREAPKAQRAFGQPRAQLRWALGHTENKFIFGGLAAVAASRKNAQACHSLNDVLVFE